MTYGFAVARRSYSFYLHPLHPLKFKISQPPGTFIAAKGVPGRNAILEFPREISGASQEVQCYATRPNRAYTTMQDHHKKEPSPAEKEQARSHPNSETNNKTRIIDPNIDYDKYPNYEVLEIKVEKVDDNETPRGDMSDIYHPEGDFGLARPWLRPVYDVDAEEPDYSEEIAAWERQRQETGESIYMPPGRTIDDLMESSTRYRKDAKQK